MQIKTNMNQSGSKRSGNSGFTLIETLIASSITVIIFGQICITIVSAQRLLEATFAETHLSLKSREMREKLLFRVNSDGGLMNADQTELIIKETGGGSGRWGKGIQFKPRKGRKNVISLGRNKKLKAEIGNGQRWLSPGTIEFQTEDVFSHNTSNQSIRVNLDLTMPVGDRRYNQQHQIRSQIINR
ncbi:MAG: prepilin-type N-terminal cleavage/methylation domain-containing protein [Kiritimatiellia bacterium]